MDNKKSKKLKALRVTQLDAQQIDEQLVNLFTQQIKRSLSEKPFTVLLNFQPEIHGLLRYILWKFSLGKSNSTIGQSLLNTEYRFNSRWNVKNQKQLHFIATVVLGYIKDRLNIVLYVIELLLKDFKKSNYYSTVEKIFNKFENVFHCLSLLNLFLFISTGNYVNLFERLLNWKHLFRGKQSPRYIDYEYMRTELVRSTISETLFIILPLINFKKVSNTIQYYLKKVSYMRKDNDNIDKTLDYICKICSERTVNPYISECEHMFCYYCIMGNIQNDNSYMCPVCDAVIRNFKPSPIILPNDM